MATLDELVSGEVEKYKTSAISDITAKAQTERQYLDEYAQILEKESNSLLGFKLGITPPAYTTDRAGVLVRDPFGFGFAERLGNLDAEEKPDSGGFLLVIGISILGYLYLKGRK